MYHLNPLSPVHYPKLCNLFNMESFANKISKIVQKRNHIHASNYEKHIISAISLDLAKRRKQLDRQINSTSHLLSHFEEDFLDKNQKGWKQFVVKQI